MQTRGSEMEVSKGGTPLWIVFMRTCVAALLFLLLLVAITWPQDTDQPLTQSESDRLKQYYATAYTPSESGLSPGDREAYVRAAAEAARGAQVKERLEQFIQENRLSAVRALDVGAGRGYLQDVLDDYTGLDISSTAQRFFHKKFVLGSATALPFPDSSFHLVWSIWVLEHVPNPEQALAEMRRVVKDGGILYLLPAWNCGPWLAEGYWVRPYSDLDLRQKILKATLWPRATMINLGHIAATPLRWSEWKSSGRPTRLRYTRLKPNYTRYWQPDSDALNNLDRYEMMIWFVSRGDECLNCAQNGGNAFPEDPRLIIKVRKEAARAGYRVGQSAAE